MPHPVPSGPVLTVTIRRDGRRVSSLRFEQPEVSIGRSPRCDIVLDDSQVSWHHALLRLDGTSGIVFSDRSSNGSFWRGERIGRAVLGRRDVVSIPPYEIDLALEEDIGEKEEPAVRTTLRASRPAGDHDRDTHGPATSPVETSPSPHAEAWPEAELHLIQAPGSLLSEVFRLETRPMTIGRAIDCDIRLTPRSVSRYHAKLSPVGPGRWNLEDVGSQNGIEVNGSLVRTAEVGIGDRIAFGTEIVALLQVPPSAPATAELPPIDSQPTTHTALDALVLRHAVSSFNPHVIVVSIVGRVDGYSYTYLRDELGKLADEGARLIIADLTQCSYCDHAGLGVLVNLQVALRPRGGGLVLIGVSGQLKDAFLLLRLDQILWVADDEQSAVFRLAKFVR